jgi:DNA-directed RNA polymerase specialized sigma24 family protein
MQETFLRAFCSIETAGEELLPWLLRGARNLYLDTWRWEKRMRPQKGHVRRKEETDGAGGDGKNRFEIRGMTL